MVIAVVQARVGSSRLPGKVLFDLNGESVLDQVLRRVRAIPRVDLVCCAIPEGADNDELAERARRSGATVCRGPEKDVLMRYLLAARSCGAHVIMRITSDCPLLDPAVSGRVLSEYLAVRADYCSNVDPRSWPRGCDTEVFSREVLERAAAETVEPYDREHVTPWMRRAAGLRRRNVGLETDRYAAWRWTLDYPADLRFARRVLALLPPPPHIPDFDEIRAVVEAHPEIAAINANLV